jgi:hypothetical protein
MMSSSTKPWKLVVMYLCVKDIDFIFVLTIFQLDFGIYSDMW